MRIAVYAICKNEEKFAQRFVESCKDADAIVVLDTGSTDNTVSVLKEAGATVHQMEFKPWRFDRPRNASLSLVPANIDVCICLDLDEVLMPGWREKLESGWKDGTRGRYRFVWSHTKDGGPDLVYWGDKIHARNGYRWKHPVHEVLQTDGITEKQVHLDLVIEHFPDASKPRSQYLPLLELATSEDPEDDRNAHYLGREYYFRRMDEKAEKELIRHLNLPRAVWKAERAASMRFIATIRERAGDHRGRIDWLIRATLESPTEREQWLDLAKAYYDINDFEGCLHAALKTLTIVERPLTYMSEARSWGPLPYDLAAIALWNVGSKERALKYARLALSRDPEDKRLQGNVELIAKLIA